MLKLTYDLALECSAQRYLDELAAANPGGSWRTVAFSENTKRHSYYAQCLASRGVCVRQLESMEIISKTSCRPNISLSFSTYLYLYLYLCLSLESMGIISKT